MATKIDSSFIKRLNKGDTKAFDRLFMDKHQQVFAYCHKFIKEEESAEEIMMDVFLTIWNKQGKLTTDGSFDALLYKITKELSFNYLKKMKREQLKLRQFQKDWSHPTHDPVDLQIKTEEYDRLADQAISQLPPKRKVIFEMRRQMGLSTHEIAQQLGISQSTVKVQLAKASKFLKNYLLTHTDITFFYLFMISISSFQELRPFSHAFYFQ